MDVCSFTDYWDNTAMLVYRSLRHGRHQTELKLRANGLHTKVEIAGSAGSTPWGSAPTCTVHPRVGHGTSCTQSKDTRTYDAHNSKKMITRVSNMPTYRGSAAMLYMTGIAAWTSTAPQSAQHSNGSA